MRTQNRTHCAPECLCPPCRSLSTALKNVFIILSWGLYAVNIGEIKISRRFVYSPVQSKTYMPKKASSPSPMSYSMPHLSVSLRTNTQ